MIKFFRQIRQRMIKENRVSKYLLYAIGEIVLVVIGILIALAINNWNEDRKLQNEELSLLAEIKTSLITNHAEFAENIAANQRLIVQYEKIETHILHDLAYSSDLDSAFGVLEFWSTPYISSSGYNTLEGKGLGLVQNKKLRKDIVDMHEVELKSIMQDYDQGEWLLSETVVPFCAKHIRRLHAQSTRLARPNDFEALKRNEEFGNLLSMILRQRKRGQEFFEDIMSKMQVLTEGIETEIELRQKTN